MIAEAFKTDVNYCPDHASVPKSGTLATVKALAADLAKGIKENRCVRRISKIVPANYKELMAFAGKAPQLSRYRNFSLEKGYFILQI